MTREEARSVLQALVTHYNAFSEESTAICKAIETLEAPPNDNWESYSKRLWKSAYERGKADAEQRWIPVSERLPDAKGSKEYLVTVAHFKPEYKGRFVEVCEYDAREFWDGRIPTWERQEDDGGRVVAWMPLPEPYEAESEG